MVSADPDPDGIVASFRIRPESSVLIVRARSSVGPIDFVTSGLTGTVTARVSEGKLVVDEDTRAHLEVELGTLQSGNTIYDTELWRRIDVRRFPHVTIELRKISPAASPGSYQLTGDVTFHGVTRATAGVVTAAMSDHRTIVVSGEQVFDVRDFAVANPTMLMLKIFPDVRLELHVEAQASC